MTTPYFVGITGGSASGKSLFLRRLLGTLPADKVCLVSEDNYYHPFEEQPLDENGVQNFDLPASINAGRFGQDLRTLRAGAPVGLQEYTFNNRTVTPRWLTFLPAPVVVVEGLFVFYHPEVAEMLDLKIFIDAREHVKLKRRLVRDQQERGYDVADVLYRYEHHVAPAYERYIAPHKGHADLVIPNNRNFDRALEIVSGFLQRKTHD